MARVLSSVTALPPHVLDRETFKRHCAAFFGASRQVDAIIDHSRIERRYLCLTVPEILAQRSLEQKSTEYSRHARKLGEVAARRALDQAAIGAEEVDFFITVSCTGLMIPSLDAYLIGALGMRRDVIRLPITELGCAGGAAALSRARDHLLAHPGHIVLIVAVELPSVTFQTTDFSQTNLIATSIFGDGAAATVVGPRTRARRPGPRLIDSATWLYPDSHHLMGFELKDGGLHIVLDRGVPEALRGNVRPHVEKLLAKHGLGLADLTFAVIHPGGRRILEDLDRDLGLRRLTQPSWDVLRQMGNLSSATVLSVLERVLGGPQPEDGSPGLLAAFGPGFSAELSLLRWDAR